MRSVGGREGRERPRRGVGEAAAGRGEERESGKVPPLFPPASPLTSAAAGLRGASREGPACVYRLSRDRLLG